MRLLLLLPALVGCATLTGARPLEQGQHELGANLGGGVVMLDGSPIPLPNVLVQGRSGLPRLAGQPFDVSYGLDLTGLPFGVLPVEVGADWLLVNQVGPWPALALTNNVWLATNAPGLPYKADPQLQLWAADQLEVNASWYAGKQLFHVGLAEYLDFGAPSLALSPSAGVRIDPSPKDYEGMQLHAEARWYGVNRTQQVDTVSWATTPHGIFGATLGVSWIFGGGL